MKLIFAFPAFLLFTNVYSQHRNDSLKLLTPKALNMVLNKALGNVASGQESGTALANHAAFDPSNSTFLVNGYVPVFYKGDTAKKLSFLNFKISGGLENGNITTLFQDTKLNSDVNIDLKYNFSVGWKGISYLRSERIKLHTQQAVFDAKKAMDSIKIRKSYDTGVLALKINSFSWDIAVQRNKQQLLNQLIDSAKARALRFSMPNLLPDSLKFYSDSVISLLSGINKVNDDIFEKTFKRDSLQKIYNAAGPLDTFAFQANKELYEQKKLELALAAKLTTLHFGWISAGFVLNKKTYFTFTETAPFADQIAKKDLEAFNLNIEYNYYYQSFARNHIFYLNAGVLKRKYNNLEELSTTGIEQERAIVNGDTKRTIKKKYDAYTSPVEEFKSVLLYTNLYYFIGKRSPLGFHLFPEIDIRETKKNPAGLGIGAVLALKDEKKDKSILNIEAYIKFRDIGNTLDTEDKFYQRMQIGARVGIPIKLIL